MCEWEINSKTPLVDMFYKPKKSQFHIKRLQCFILAYMVENWRVKIELKRH